MFKRLSLREGLSQSTVQCFLKDKEGFVWIGTRDGLNRFDGYQFKVYMHDSTNQQSIINNRINDMLQDRQGNLWIGTSGGLDRFDRSTETFVHYSPGSQHTNIRDIFQDSQDNIWLSTNQGLFLFNPTNGAYKHYQHNDNDPTSIFTNDIGALVEDQEGSLWIASDKGVLQFDRDTQTFSHSQDDPVLSAPVGSKHIWYIHRDKRNNMWIVVRDGGLVLYSPSEKSVHNVSNNDVLTVQDGPDGRLWIGTDKNGIYRYDYETKSLSSFQYDQRDNTIRCFYKDDVGNFWIGTHSGGALLLSKSETCITYYKPELFHANNLSSNIVTDILEDSDGNLWIGTDGGGVNFIDFNLKKVTHYKKEATSDHGLFNNFNYAIVEVNEDVVAFGNYKGGLALYNKKRKQFKTYLFSELHPDEINTPAAIFDIVKDNNDKLWLASSYGVIHFNPTNGHYTTYQPSDEGSKIIYTMHIDSQQNMWIGGNNGLYRYKDGALEGAYSINTTNQDNNRIHCIYEDAEGQIWVASNGFGLNLFDKKTYTFTSFTEKDGLADDVVFGILPDDHGNLWLSTGNGLGKFHIKTRTFQKYDIGQNDLINEFKRGAFYKNNKGKMYFGSSGGFIVFHPDSLKDNTYVPPIVLTDFHVFNKSIVSGGPNSSIKQSLNDAKGVTLSYSQSVFSIFFAALNFTHPEENQYAYMLEGFDKDWHYVGATRSATYTNLDPGDYVFKVKGCNNDGLWNEQAKTIKIIITPPFWKTWWFRTGMLFSLAAGGFAWYRRRFNQIHAQKRELERIVKERTSELTRQGLVMEGLYKDVQDSIRSAQVLQRSMLPSPDRIKKYLPECFILNRPKDIVSGDFYWFDKRDEQIILAIADCTGHGVSGAFMSINGHHLLKSAINSHQELIASDILDQLNIHIIEGLNSKEHQQGMDIALCIIDLPNCTLQYAGACSPLYIVRNGELMQIKANPFPLGQMLTDSVPKFCNHRVPIQNGDMIYLFSDGYPDQIGGPQMNKFTYPRFREMLTSISVNPADLQQELLDKTLTEWKGDLEQLDDILVVGFRIPY